MKSRVRGRVLVVEDLEATRGRLRSVLESPPEDFQDVYSIEGFVVDEAATASEATAHLASAAARSEPYDVVLLDLGIPRNSADALSKIDDPKPGLEILTTLDNRVCRSVVVQTALGREVVLRELIASRRVDGYVDKDFDPRFEAPFRAVVEAYRTSQRARLSNKRMDSWLVQQARLQVSDQIGALIADAVGNLMADIRSVISLVDECFHVNARMDSDHPVLLRIESMRSTVQRLAERDREFPPHLPPGQSRYEKSDIAAVVNDVVEDVGAGWAALLKLDIDVRGPVFVHTFIDDVRGIIGEIVYGAVESVRERVPLKVSVCRSSDNATIEVQVQDVAATIDDVSRRQIENGDPAGRVGDRGWGLALAQRAAMNIGANLELHPAEPGNLIVLRIPVTADD